MKYHFDVKFLKPAEEFLDKVDPVVREKIIYNIWKSRYINDNELLKKLTEEIWEFRTLFKKTHYRLFAFWDKRDKKSTLIICSHGILKKNRKLPTADILRAKKHRTEYFQNLTVIKNDTGK